MQKESGGIRVRWGSGLENYLKKNKRVNAYYEHGSVVVVLFVSKSQVWYILTFPHSHIPPLTLTSLWKSKVILLTFFISNNW